MHIVRCKWVFKVKHNLDKFVQRYKARLVLKGFQQTLSLDYFKTLSPMVKSATIRVMLNVVVKYNWDIRWIDVNNAFLNHDFFETMYMHQLEGFSSDTSSQKFVYKLTKFLYGLKQTPRAYFDKLKDVLLS